MNTLPVRLRAALVALFIVAAAASCGRKTEPLTPPSPRPERIQDLQATARDGTAFLSWPIPAKNVEGVAMNPAEILGFRVYRAEVEQSARKAKYHQVAEIDLAHPAPAEVRNGRVFWNDTDLRYGQLYAYRIRTISARGGLSQPSEEVTVTPLLSLAAPKWIKAAGGDGEITLSWAPVAARSDGSVYSGFVGYNLYRGTEPDGEAAAPLNAEPVRTTDYRDAAVVNGRTYYYRVRAVDSPARPWKESLDSPEVSAMARDLTPPARPTGLTAVPGVGRIFLTWNENHEADLAGYYVYRSRKNGRDFERLTEKPIDRSTYSDEKVKPGVDYYYVVSAVDRSGNESAFSKEQKGYAESPRGK